MRNVQYSESTNKNFRDSAYIKDGTRWGHMALGKTIVEQTFVHTEWFWLIIPVLVWVLSVLLWVGTAVQSWKRNVPVWRNNPAAIDVPI